MSRVIELTGGSLRIEVHSADLPLDALCEFASRINPKRGFLFVSKVLGRHLPVRPAVMRDVWRRLAEKLPVDLPGPVVFVGLAETAITLGLGVFTAWLEMTGRDDVLFLHSTRYALPRPLAFEFTEAHSHASDHRVFQPIAGEDQSLLAAARSLIVVDDEASTGGTLTSLVRAAASACPHLERTLGVVLTDWRGLLDERPDAAGIECISLLAGRYEFTPTIGAPAPAMPRATGDGRPRPELMRRNFGRLGLRAACALTPAEIEALLDAPPIAPGGRCLVLGSGEFTWAPFLMAEALAARGADAFVQSTTRSPIRIGHAIGAALTFPDNYGDGISNYLYNVQPGQYDRVIIAYETPRGWESPFLAETLRARSVYC